MRESGLVIGTLTIGVEIVVVVLDDDDEDEGELVVGAGALDDPPAGAEAGAEYGVVEGEAVVEGEGEGEGFEVTVDVPLPLPGVDVLTAATGAAEAFGATADAAGAPEADVVEPALEEGELGLSLMLSGTGTDMAGVEDDGFVEWPPACWPVAT